MACKRSCRVPWLAGEEKAHAAARHSAEHPEAPEVVAHFRAHAANQRVGVEVARPGNDGLNGAVKILFGGGAQAANVARLLQACDQVVEDPAGFLAALPFALRPQQVFLRDHFQNRADVLSHTAVDEQQALLKLLARFRPHLLRAKNFMVGVEPAAALAPRFPSPCTARHASGPRTAPAATWRSASAAAARASSASTRTTALSFGLIASIRARCASTTSAEDASRAAISLASSPADRRHSSCMIGSGGPPAPAANPIGAAPPARGL